MGQLQFKRQALDDLKSIWLGIATRDEKAADRIFDLIRDRCQFLRDHPGMGRSRPEVGLDAPCLVVENWVVFYRLVAGDVQIIRVIDGR